jgi:hypothetical protein
MDHEQSTKLDAFISGLIGGLNDLSNEITHDGEAGSLLAPGASTGASSFRNYLDILDIQIEEDAPQAQAVPETAEEMPTTPAAAELEKCRQLLLARWTDWNRTDMLTREDVDAFLSGRSDGAFVVRPSNTKENCLVLCLKFASVVIHYLIDRLAPPVTSLTPQG